MPVMIFFMLFGLVASIMAAIVIGSGDSRQQLTSNLVRDTEGYFRNINTMVLQEMTEQNLEVVPRAMPPMTTMQAGQSFLSSQMVRQLGTPGQWGNPLLDAWGSPIHAQLVRQNTAMDPSTTVPITGVVLQSAGPDRVSQTIISPLTSLGMLQGILPVGDDIVTTFTDEEAQRKTMAHMRDTLASIAAVVKEDYVRKLLTFSNQIRAEYEAEAAINPNASSPNLRDTLLTHPAAPRFADIGLATERNRLGLNAEIAKLERTLPNGGRMQVVNISNTPLQAMIGLRNDPLNPSPWVLLGPHIVIQGGPQ
jgi:hypothetical protein